MRKKCFCWFLILLCFTALSVAIAQGDNEEVSINIFDASGNVVAGDPTPSPYITPAPTVDVAEAVYEKDGSIIFTMSFTGDVTIGSNVQYSGKSIFETELEVQDGDINFPFRNVTDIFEADDLTIVNFEGTLTTAGRNSNKLSNDYLFRADPSYVEMLPNASVECVSLENNHVLDMGETGLAETKQTLLDAGVMYASEGEPAIMTIKGVTVGSLAYQTFGGLHQQILDALPEAIQELRDAGCDIVIVNYHWGSELDYYPNDNQIMLGRGSIDAGADLVIGHHSHVINPIEYYNGKYIVYSLGNFSFAGNSKPNDMSTYIFQLQVRLLDGEITEQNFKIIPCRISSRRDYNDFAPTPYTDDENIEALLSVLKKNGLKLEYAVEDYPLLFPSEDM